MNTRILSHNDTGGIDNLPRNTIPNFTSKGLMKFKQINDAQIMK